MRNIADRFRPICQNLDCMLQRGCDKTTIQAAINAASPGDTIEVHSGKYLESVEVTKRLVLRGRDTGSGMPIVDAQDSGSVVINLMAGSDKSVVEGFDVRRASNGFFVRSSDNRIAKNNASGNYYGIYLSHSNNNDIIGNIVNNNIYDAITIEYSNNNLIAGNVVSSNRIGRMLQIASTIQSQATLLKATCIASIPAFLPIISYFSIK
jgi:parallel beta-helix repeat protein